MKHLKKPFCFILAGLSMLLLTACSGAGTYQESIYEDDEKISAQGDSYTFVNRTGDSDDASLSLAFSGFSGKQTLWKAEADEDGTISMDAEIIIKGGRFKLCLIDPDNNVTVITDDSISDEISVPVVKGISRIVIVGSGAKGEIEISLSGSEDITIQCAGE